MHQESDFLREFVRCKHATIRTNQHENRHGWKPADEERAENQQCCINSFYIALHCASLLRAGPGHPSTTLTSRSRQCRPCSLLPAHNIQNVRVEIYHHDERHHEERYEYNSEFDFVEGIVSNWTCLPEVPLGKEVRHEERDWNHP